MAESLGSAVLELRVDMRKYRAGVGDAEQLAKKLGASFKAAGQQLTRVGKSMSTFVTLPLLAVGAAAIKASADAEEAGNKFRVVMGAGAEAANAALEKMTATIPLTLDEMQKLSASVQDLLVPLGIARDEAAGLSVDTVKLAGDLASFNNVGADKVMEAISSALGGMSRPMRQFGVDTSVARLKTLALSEGLIQQGEEMSKAVSAQAVLIAIQKDSSDAMGDAARTVDSTANSFRFLWRDIRVATQVIGDILVPMILPLVQRFKDMVNAFANLNPAWQKLIVVVGLAAAALGPVLIAAGLIASAVGSLIPLLGGIGLSGAFTALVATITGPVGLTVALLALASQIPVTRGIMDDMADAAVTIAEKITGLTLRVVQFNDATKVTTEGQANFLAMIAGGEPVLTSHKNSVGDAWRAQMDMAQSAEDLATQIAETAAAAAAAVPKNQRLTGSFDEIETAALAAERALRANTAALVEYSLANRDLQVGAIRTDEILTDFGGATLPKMVPPLKDIAEKTGNATQEFGDMFSQIRTGNATVDGFLGKMKGFLGIFKSIAGALSGASKGFGDFFGKIGGLFGGGGGGGGGGGEFFGDLTAEAFNVGKTAGSAIGTGATEAATSIFSKLPSFVQSAVNFLPIIGPLLAAFGGPLFKGIKALAGKIWGGLKSMFGGPGAAELEARKIGSSLNSMLAGVLTEQDKIIAGNEQWKISNIGVNRIYEAAGLSMAEAAAMATRLSDSVRMTPVEAQKVIDEIQAVYDAGIGAIGDTVDEIVTQTTTANQAVVDSVTDTTRAIEGTAARAAASVSRSFRDLKFDIPVNFSLGDMPKGTGQSGATSNSGIPKLARGGIVNKPTVALIGEGGPEAVVPLSGRGKGGGSLTLNLVVDGERMATKVVQMTPDILRSLGIG